MRNDDRKIFQAKIENGVVVPSSLNDCLRQLSEAILTLEGRKGPINLRDSLSLTADGTQTAVAAIGPEGSKGRLEAAFRGTLGAELELGQGTRHDQDTRYATVTDPVSINFRPGRIDFQADTGLTAGQAYVPTVVGSLFANQPLVRVYNASGFDVANNTTVTVEFATETFDRGNMFNVATPGSLTVRAEGFYLFGYSAEWTFGAGAAQTRRMFMTLNGSDTVKYGESEVETTFTNNSSRQNGSALEFLPVGTTIQLRAFAFGANTSLTGVANTSPVLWAVRLP